jgi:hypothetical protein
MKNQLTIKVFKMNYDFLIKNYLNPELWQKEWTLFEFKFYKVTMNLYSINTKNEKILLELHICYKDPDAWCGYSTEKTVDYSLKINDIEFLKRKINSAIWEGIQSLESNYLIEGEDEYQNLISLREREKERLGDIAREFLEDNGIENEHIIEAYTEAYIDEYEKTWSLMQDYKSNRKYHVSTDFYLTWLNSLEDSKDKESRLNWVKDVLSSQELQNVLNEISEYQEYIETEEWEDEAKEKLEEV